jgi:hypothetical protein
MTPRPPVAWPHEGSISVEKLVIRYAVCGNPDRSDNMSGKLTYSRSYRMCFTAFHSPSRPGRRLVSSELPDAARVPLLSASSDSSKHMKGGSSSMEWVSSDVHPGTDMDRYCRNWVDRPAGSRHHHPARSNDPVWNIEVHARRL